MAAQQEPQGRQLAIEVGTPMGCPACGASDWCAQIMTEAWEGAKGLRVQTVIDHAGVAHQRLCPDTWGDDYDTHASEPYAWECLADGCGRIYADSDLNRWVLHGGPPPAPTSYSGAEATWLRERLARITS